MDQLQKVQAALGIAMLGLVLACTGDPTGPRMPTPSLEISDQEAVTRPPPTYCNSITNNCGGSSCVVGSSGWIVVSGPDYYKVIPDDGQQYVDGVEVDRSGEGSC